MKNLFVILFGIVFPLSFKEPINKPENPSKTEKTIRVALLLDTSNSMDGLINQAKSQLWKIVNELSYAKCEHETPNLEIALYEYGNDNIEASDNYIRQIVPFNSDLDEISKQLFALRTNGGNEYCGTVISTSLQDLKWGKNKKDLNLIFIAGNEPFTQGRINYKDAITDAKEKNITVNTIFCGDYENGIRAKWYDAAVLGNGEYLNINPNKEIIHVITPYDKEIIILNERLNKTYIYFGTSGQKYYQNQQIQDNNAMELEEAVIVNRAVSKSNKIYNNSSWDLVDATKNGNISLEKIKRKNLPKNLQNKTIKELKEYVTKQKTAREKIQKEIQQLNEKRRKYIATNQTKENMDALESVMLKAIKKQATKKGYSW